MEASMEEPRTLNPEEQRTRRNVMKMSVILASAGLARAKMAHAQTAQTAYCATAIGCRCFLSGTKIQTVEGERKIEDLVAGDLLPTMFGGVRPIQWIARYPVKKSDPAKPWVKDALPVRIARSAFAPNVPHADLYITGGHALLIDGVLIPVGNLINGTTIRLNDAREYDELEYFNIKLESHDVIYAEGTPVETLLKVDDCAVNFAEYFRMYGIPKTEEARCASFATYGGGRGELKSRVRSAISPWLDRRQPIDVVRDRVEERGIALSRHLEPSL
jgi:hypothetical protein